MTNTKVETYYKREKYKFLKGNIIGAITTAIVAVVLFYMLPSKSTIVHVPVVKVIEKPVIRKVPIKFSNYDRQQVQCMAENVYFEARDQSIKGQIAVLNVVMNRVKDPRFPKTPCGVIKQKSNGVCQFSWVCQNLAISDNTVLYKAKKLAAQVYISNIGDVTRGAKFYHAVYVNPKWSYRKTTTIGDHIFYRG